MQPIRMLRLVLELGSLADLESDWLMCEQATLSVITGHSMRTHLGLIASVALMIGSD